jgi:hypothetical protein
MAWQCSINYVVSRINVGACDKDRKLPSLAFGLSNIENRQEPYIPRDYLVDPWHIFVLCVGNIIISIMTFENCEV